MLSITVLLWKKIHEYLKIIRYFGKQENQSFKKSCYLFFATTFLILFSLSSKATTYYVSSAGNDSNAGTSENLPWQSLSKVNSFTPRPGDQILFKSGDSWTGTITVRNSGTAGNPIVYGAYGVGEKPIISGFSTITSGWTNEGGGIYSKNLSAESSPQMVTIEGVQYAMGRWPNSGWNIITGTSGATQITDANLTATPNWTGANVVIRMNHWIIDRDPITNHSATTLTFESNSFYSPSAGWGYFIQNSLSTLDTYGEWYYNTTTGTFYMYFGALDPTTKKVMVSTVDKGIISANRDYITIDGLSIIGMNAESIYLYPTPTYTIVQNCNIDFSGGNAIRGHYPAYCSVLNTKINHTNNTAIFFSDTGTGYNKISYNEIKNTGMIAGMGRSGDRTYKAILNKRNNSTIKYNTIVNTGYSAITYGGQNTIVNNNFIDNYCSVLDDGGGIYCYNDTETGKQVLNNIVLNGIGAHSGTNTSVSSANGLYADGFSSNITYSGNTLANITKYGFHSNIAESMNITLENNTFFEVNSMYSLQRWLSGFSSGLTSKNNVFVTTRLDNINGIIRYKIDMDGKDLPFYNNNILDEVANLGTIDSNYYHTNIDKASLVSSSAPNSFYNTYTNSEWQNTYKYDTHSSFYAGENNPAKYDFKYNATVSPKTIALATPMIDAKGKKYSGTITLQPFTSVVLMKDTSISEDTTAPIITELVIPGTYGSLTVPVSSITASDNIAVTGYLLTETAAVPNAENTNWTSYCPNSYTFASEGTKTLFAWAKDNAGNVSDNASAQVVITLPDLYTIEEISICEGSSYEGWNSSGHYQRVITSVSGADSIVTTNLKVNPVFDINEDVIILTGEKYFNWTESGNYQRVLTSSTGCDSIITTRLLVKKPQIQSISLEKGWNIFSSNLVPRVLGMDSVQKSLCDDGLLVKVQDEVGNTFEKCDSANVWLNNIGEIQKSEGYKIKVDSFCVLEITGNTIQLPLNINLKSGSNLISFPYNKSIDAMHILQPVIEKGILDKVQDEKGNSIEYWGSSIGWINEIGNFNPGEGYLVQVNSNGNLPIFESYEKSGSLFSNNLKNNYFNIDYEGNGSNHMNINIAGLNKSNFQVGDEIAAFDGEICVGAIKLTQMHLNNNVVSISASVSDINMNNGFTEGNEITLKFWKAQENKEIQLILEVFKGVMKYKVMGSVFVMLNNQTTNYSNEFNPVDFNIYPNPSSNNVTVMFHNGFSKGAQIVIIDSTGKIIENREAKSSSELFNISPFANGIYFVKTISGEKCKIDKLVKN